MSLGSGDQILFKHPPVVEKAMGVEFAPLPGWAVPHFGLLWSEIRSEFPSFEFQPPLLSQIEHTEQRAPQVPGFSIELGDSFRMRAWFIKSGGAQLIQIQDSRFIVNWRRVSPTDPYPHYNNFKPIFEQEWKRFTGFLGRNGFPEPRVVQCELTYVNHIARGLGWTDYADMPRVFSTWAGTGPSLPKPEMLAWNTSFLLPDNRGRLHAAVQPVVRLTDAQEALQMTLTARGAPSGATLPEALDWFDFGRTWLVDAFRSLTSSEMQKVWNAGE
jgi:uncharacterized protein (TIGR04255 family)